MSLKFKVKMTPAHPARDLERLEEWYPGQLQKAHRGGVMRILETYVAWSRVDTGRFRAGWYAYMRAYGFPFQRSVKPGKDETAIAEAEGEALGMYQEEPLRTVVYNGVNYGPPLEERTGIFDREGRSAFIPSPFRGLADCQQYIAERYSKVMETVMDNMAEAHDKGDLTDDGLPFFDSGPPSAGQ